MVLGAKMAQQHFPANREIEMVLLVLQVVAQIRATTESPMNCHH
jgi:hypothetical protein